MWTPQGRNVESLRRVLGVVYSPLLPLALALLCSSVSLEEVTITYPQRLAVSVIGVLCVLRVHT